MFLFVGCLFAPLVVTTLVWNGIDISTTARDARESDAGH